MAGFQRNRPQVYLPTGPSLPSPAQTTSSSSPRCWVNLVHFRPASGGAPADPEADFPPRPPGRGRLTTPDLRAEALSDKDHPAAHVAVSVGPEWGPCFQETRGFGGPACPPGRARDLLTPDPPPASGTRAPLWTREGWWAGRMGGAGRGGRVVGRVGGSGKEGAGGRGGRRAADGAGGGGLHQEEAGADELPAQPPVEAGPPPGHLLDVVAELPDTCSRGPGRASARPAWRRGPHPPAPQLPWSSGRTVLPRAQGVGHADWARARPQGDPGVTDCTGGPVGLPPSSARPTATPAAPL